MKAKRRYLPNFEARSVMIIAAWAVGSAAAQAQTPYSPPPRPQAPMAAPSGAMDPPRAGAKEDASAEFMRADSNRDGKLSRKEAQAIPSLAQHFEQVDADHDGFISREEYDKAMK
ncbi:MAG: EF-hand domain-containing protein [Burkholderiaceae bacterium]|nr:MAG: EF-hand domain-containing protein [Burkholderiaceae bacterium]